MDAIDKACQEIHDDSTTDELVKILLNLSFPSAITAAIEGEDNEEPNEMEEDEAVEAMNEQLAKPKKDQDKALIIKAQRSTFRTRRQFINSQGDGNMKAIAEKYPILKIPKFMEKEFYLMKTSLKKETIIERWTDSLHILDRIFGVEKDSDDEGNEDQEVLSLMRKIEQKIKFRTTKTEIDLITEVDVKSANLESKKKSPPRVVVLKNADKTVNAIYIVGDGLKIEAGKDVKTALELLLITYYIYDLSYPKCYQLMGFLQLILLEDDAHFHKGANFLKFEKEWFKFKEDLKK